MKRSILKFKCIGTAVITLILCAIPYVVVGIATPAAAQIIQQPTSPPSAQIVQQPTNSPSAQTLQTQNTLAALAECNKRGWCFVTTNTRETLCVPCDGSCFALETTAYSVPPTYVPPTSTTPLDVYLGFPYYYKDGRYKASDLKTFIKYAPYPRNMILSTFGCLIVNTTRKTIDFKAGSEYFRIQYGLPAN